MQHRDSLQDTHQFVQHGAVVRRLFVQLGDFLHQCGPIQVGKRLNEPDHVLPVDAAEHGADRFRGHVSGAECDGLIQQAKAIPHAAVRSSGQRPQAVGFRLEFFFAVNFLQLLVNLRHCQSLQVELQATRQHRHRQLLGIGGRQQELDMRGRFLQRLEQRVEGVIRQHVHLVDEVDLESPLRRRVLGVFHQFPGIVHPGARRRVHFDEIHEAAVVDCRTRIASAAGLGNDAFRAIQRLGEYSSQRGLADTACTCEQVGMVEALRRERVHQRLDDVLLANHFRKASRPPFSCKNRIAHEWRAVSYRNARMYTRPETELRNTAIAGAPLRSRDYNWRVSAGR